MSTSPVTNGPERVDFVAREKADHGDGRVYGGIVSPTAMLTGTLGSYRGCLIETRSRTLVVLSGAMEFREADNNSAKPYIYSKSLLGDSQAMIIPIDEDFEVRGSFVDQLPEGVDLQSPIPQACARLPMFFTTTETFKPTQ